MGTTSDAKLDIIVERNPSDERLSELGIKSWPKWGCPAGKIILKYEATETCYFVKGRVKAYLKGHSNSITSSSSSSSSSSGSIVEFGAGDLVIFPKGVSCVWDVSLPVDKYYKFDPPS